MNRTIITILTIAVISSTSFGVGFGLANYKQKNLCNKNKLDGLETAIIESEEIDHEIAKISAKSAEKQKEIRIVYKDRIKEVVKYVEKSDNFVCLTPMQLCTVNQNCKE